MRTVFLACLIVLLAAFTASPASAQDGWTWGAEFIVGAGTGATAASITDVPEDIRTIETYNVSREDRRSWVIPDPTMNPRRYPIGHVQFGPILTKDPIRLRAGFGADWMTFIGGGSSEYYRPGAGYKCYGDPPTYESDNPSYPVPDYMRCYNEGQTLEDGRTSYHHFPVFLSAWPNRIFLVYGGMEYRVSRLIGLTTGYTFRFYRLNFMSGVDSYGGENEKTSYLGAHTSSVDAGLRLYVKQSTETSPSYAIELSGSYDMPKASEVRPDKNFFSIRIGVVVQYIND